MHDRANVEPVASSSSVDFLPYVPYRKRAIQPLDRSTALTGALMQGSHDASEDKRAEEEEDRIDELWQPKAKPPRETFEGPPRAHVGAPHTMDPGDKLYPAPRHTVDVDAEALRASRQQEVRRPRSGWAPPPHFLAGGASPPQSRTAAKLRQCPRCMVLYLAENHTCVPVSSAPVTTLNLPTP